MQPADIVQDGGVELFGVFVRGEVGGWVWFGLLP